MSKFAFIIFPDNKKLTEGVSVLEELDSEGSITVYSKAVVGRNENDDLFLKEPADASLLGSPSGSLAGGLIGLINGPVGGVTGPAGGALLGSAWDLFRYGLNVDFVQEIAESAAAGDGIIVAEVSETVTGPLDQRIDDIGGTISRIWRVNIEDQQIAQNLEQAEAECHALKAELMDAARKENAKFAARIDEANAKLQLVKDEALDRLNNIEKEFEAKAKKLEQQLTGVSAHAGATINRRIDALHADYKLWTDKLKKAWSTNQETPIP
ncbi:DUF1269 domain-containing protein [Parasphingorhabdus sp.]|uniref:DUF1269 domain-containing protein n=1 Tax=Parasphingorhabdus sp. TaxID=2709688 RepID=UPI003A926964